MNSIIKQSAPFVLLMLLPSLIALGQRAELKIEKEDSTSDFRLLHEYLKNHFTYEIIEEDNLTKITLSNFEKGILYLQVAHNNRLRLLLDENTRAHIRIVGDQIEVISSNSREFSAFVAYQNFFNQQFKAELHPLDTVFREKIASYDENKSVVDSKLFNQIKAMGFDEESSFYNLIVADYIFQVRELMLRYWMYDAQFYLRYDSTRRSVGYDAKSRKKLDKFLDQAYPVSMPKDLEIWTGPILFFAMNEFLTDYNQGVVKFKKNEKSFQKFIRKQEKQYGSDMWQDLMLGILIFIAWEEDVDWIDQQMAVHLKKPEAQQIWASTMEQSKMKRSAFEAAYINKEREQIFLEAPTAIEAYRDFLEANRGKIVLIDIWTTTCRPCLMNFPYSNKVKDELEGEEVVFLYINLDADKKAERAQQLVAEYNLGGSHIIIADQKVNGENIKSHFEVNFYPRYIILGRDGEILEDNTVQPMHGEGLFLKKRLMEHIGKAE